MNFRNLQKRNQENSEVFITEGSRDNTLLGPISPCRLLNLNDYNRQAMTAGMQMSTNDILFPSKALQTSYFKELETYIVDCQMADKLLSGKIKNICVQYVYK